MRMDQYWHIILVGQREDFLQALTAEERVALEHAWWYWARKEQIAPPESEAWFV